MWSVGVSSFAATGSHPRYLRDFVPCLCYLLRTFAPETTKSIGMKKIIYFIIAAMAILCLLSCASHKSMTDTSFHMHTADTIASVAIVSGGVGETAASRDTLTLHLTDSTTCTVTDSLTVTEHVEEKVTFRPDGSRTEERTIDRTSVSVLQQEMQSAKNLIELQLHEYTHRLDSLASSATLAYESHTADSVRNDVQEENQPSEVSWYDKFILVLFKPFFSITIFILVTMAVWRIIRRKW